MKKRFMKDYIEFSDKFFNTVIENNKKGNVFVSPYSMIVPISMLSDATGSETNREIKKAVFPRCLGYEISGNIKNMSDKLKECGDVDFSDANAIVLADTYGRNINKSFMDKLREVYGAETFTSPVTADDINKWVREKTKGMISDALDSLQDFVLINVCAFISEWADDYKDSDIKENEVFTNINRQKEKVTMLHSIENTVLENRHLIGFKKSYKGGKYSFVAVRPKNRWKLDADSITVKQICELIKRAKMKTAYVYMPEFSYGFKMEATKNLRKMGINSAIDSQKADFSRMIDLPGTHVNSIIHKAFIQVDREGTKAAALSEDDIFGSFFGNSTDIETIRMDRPFVFAIIHEETQLPVFVGTLNSVKGTE